MNATSDDRQNGRLDSSGNRLYETQNFALLSNESNQGGRVFATMAGGAMMKGSQNSLVDR